VIGHKLSSISFEIRVHFVFGLAILNLQFWIW